jgi:hypothetical protein
MFNKTKPYCSGWQPKTRTPGVGASGRRAGRGLLGSGLGGIALLLLGRGGCEEAVLADEVVDEALAYLVEDCAIVLGLGRFAHLRLASIALGLGRDLQRLFGAIALGVEGKGDADARAQRAAPRRPLLGLPRPRPGP